MSYKTEMNIATETTVNSKTTRNAGEAIAITMFTLADFGLTHAQITTDADGKDSAIVSDDATVNLTTAFVINAIQSAVKDVIRSRNKSKTAGLPATLADLVTPLVGNGGNHMILQKEFVAGFVAYLASSGLKEAVQLILSKYATLQGRTALQLASEKHREAMTNRLAAYADSLNEEAVTKYEGLFASLSEACKGVVVNDEDFN